MHLDTASTARDRGGGGPPLSTSQLSKHTSRDGFSRCRAARLVSALFSGATAICTELSPGQGSGCATDFLPKEIQVELAALVANQRRKG